MTKRTSTATFGTIVTWDGSTADSSAMASRNVIWLSGVKLIASAFDNCTSYTTVGTIVTLENATFAASAMSARKVFTSSAKLADSMVVSETTKTVCLVVTFA